MNLDHKRELFKASRFYTEHETVTVGRIASYFEMTPQAARDMVLSMFEMDVVGTHGNFKNYKRRGKRDLLRQSWVSYSPVSCTPRWC